MNPMTFLPYARQSIDSADIAAVGQALAAPLIAKGPLAADFEQGIAEYCSAKYAVAFSSGTAAMQAAAWAVGISRYDRVITSANAFAGMLVGAIQQGASPVLVDIDPTTGNLDLEQVGQALRERPSRGRNIVIPLHFAGIPVDMRRLESKVADPDVVIIEDATHALGAAFSDGTKVGSCRYCDIAIFSFEPTKSITAAEGGMALTDNEALYRRLMLYRNNAIVNDPEELLSSPGPWYYEITEVTGDHHMSEMQAALGLSQLRKLDHFVARRRQLMGQYREQLADLPYLTFPTAENDSYAAHHLLVVRIDFSRIGRTRSWVMETLKERGIGTQVHYTPLYRQPFIGRLEHQDLTPYFPQMEAHYQEALTLPLYPDLTDGDVTYISSVLKEILKV